MTSLNLTIVNMYKVYKFNFFGQSEKINKYFKYIYKSLREIKKKIVLKIE